MIIWGELFLMLYLITFVLIMILIFVNGFTDSPNAITTVVSTKVLSFRKAAFLGALFNSLGIIVMCVVNFSVADCISSIVVLEKGTRGLIALSSSIFSVVIFSVLASLVGIPTSETHGLIAGLTGSVLVTGSIQDINSKEWMNVIIGLVWSIFGTYIITKILYFIFCRKVKKIAPNKIKKYQKYSSFGLSFMHGAQDGQKFIGIVILFMYIVKGDVLIKTGNALDNLWIIIFVAIVMFFGVSIGGKKIVENIGNNTAKLDNVSWFFSDLGTVVNLFLASIFGIPVSTTHVKTVSIIALGKENSNKQNILNIFKAWIWTFPVCFVLAFLIAKGLFYLFFNF